MTIANGSKSNGISGLHFRLATPDDLPLLQDMRRECGWGIEKLNRQVANPDWSFCIFLKEIDGEMKEVGMGGWVLDDADDPEKASRANHTVYLTSLYIRENYQSTGLGSEAMSLLEQAAVDIYDARVLTLDTYSHPFVVASDGKYEHRSEDVSKTRMWYRKIGYTEFREPAFIYPDDPRVKGSFLRKVMG